MDNAQNLIDLRKQQIDKLDLLVKSKFIDMFGDPVTNPKGWEIVKLNDVIRNIEAGWSVGGEQRPKTQDEKAVLKVSSVTKGYFDDTEYKVIDKNIEIKKYVYPQKGDLLFSRANTRELVGATCIVHKDYNDLLLPDKLWKLNLREAANIFFIKSILSVECVRSEFSKVATGTSGSMYNISMGKLKEIKINLPPLTLQNQFADFVEQVEQQKDTMQKSLDKLEQNYKSLMQKCFAGKIF